MGNPIDDMPNTDEDKPTEEAESSRMSFGDHLDQLRKCVIYSLLVLLAAVIICFNLGDHIIATLTTPYKIAMEDLGFDPRMVQLKPIEAFIEYFKISLKFGLVAAAPFILVFIWRFVATGLYPQERRIVRYFAPTSIFLFLLGSSFMITIVLSGLMKFLIGISMWFPLPGEDNWLHQWFQSSRTNPVVATQPAPPPMEVPVVVVDPEEPIEGQIWFNPTTSRLNVHHEDETFYFRMQKKSAQQFVQPFFSISEYLGFVVNLALAFGLGFQIPIVVVFLIAMRIINAKIMSQARKWVILGVAILAAILTPTPDVGTMLLLAVPMIALFEIGLLIGRVIERKRAKE